MANDLTQNPWTFDTTATSTAGGYPTSVKVSHFEFIDYTADGDTAQIKNGLGKVIWEANGAVDLQPIRSGKVGWVDTGLFLSALSNAASRVRVYIE